MVAERTVDPVATGPRDGADDEITVEIAFHPDLRRVGDARRLGPASREVTLDVGRDVAFGPRGAARPLGDPCVSREQARVRWLPDRRAFRVERAAGARRELTCFDPHGRPIEGDVPAGGFVAVGDRVLLLLAARPVDEHDELGLLGASAAMIDARARIRALARADDPVLVTGETGTGKELAAAALHAAGSRARGPFVAVNCASLPASLAESELFGHERGAFSGADAARAGLFRRAAGGTLFLDEIGELGAEVQAKLLRAVQTGSVRAVGGGVETRVDARLVAATHRDLAGEVEAGRFREDLFARLDGLGVVLPPLRERREDVPRLFATFFRRRASQAGSTLARFVRDADAHATPVPLGAVLALIRHDFPRNVRELEKHVATIAAATTDGGPLVVPPLRASATPSAAPDPIRERPARDELARLLERHDYVQQRVARALGVSHTTVDRWRRELGLHRPRELDAAAITAALTAADGRIEAAARSLAVSARGLRLRMTELGLRG